MRDKKNDGGSAFPSEQHETMEGTWNQTFEAGMSLRDYFAGQCISGLLPGSSFEEWELQNRAKWAYDMADAMLKEREK